MGEKGGRLSSASVGGWVASASEASESMIRFTHSIWTAVRGLPRVAMAPTLAVATATTFTTNCREMISIIQRCAREQWTSTSYPMGTLAHLELQELGDAGVDVAPPHHCTLH